MEEKKILIKEDDLLKVLGDIIARWKFVMTVSLCFAVFGVIIALSTPRSYTAETVVAPETSSSSIAGSGLSSLASMVGVDFGATAGGDAIYPMLYPDIIGSLPFLTSLFDVRVKNEDETCDTTYYAYLKHYRKRTWLDYAKALPSKTINWITGFFSSSTAVSADSRFNPYMLSKSQMRMVETLNSTINIFVDKKTDVITLSFTDRDSRVAAIMADTIMNRLQQEVTRYRIKKASDDCKYIARMYNEAKDSLDISQQRYADFVSRNKNIINEYVIIEKERLEADKELKMALHTQWAQQLLLAKAKVQEQTPVYVTLKPTVIPAIPSSMGRATRVILFALLGGIFAVAYVLLKEPICSKWHKIMRKSEE